MRGFRARLRSCMSAFCIGFYDELAGNTKDHLQGSGRSEEGWQAISNTLRFSFLFYFRDKYSFAETLHGVQRTARRAQRAVKY